MFVSGVLIAVVVMGLFVDFPEWTTGAQEAQEDIQRGHLEIRGYGLPARWMPLYARLLKERLGVRFNEVAGCMVSRRLEKHTKAYNEMMMREIERRYGAGILEKLADEASEMYAATQHAERIN